MKLHFLLVASMPLFLSQTAPLSMEAGPTELVLETDSDCVYYLESGIDLNDFTYTGEIIKGDGTTHRKTFSITEPRRFFRYQEIQNADLDTIDTDQDGLSDAFELHQSEGTYSPILTDTDENGTNDGDEDLDDDGQLNTSDPMPADWYNGIDHEISIIRGDYQYYKPSSISEEPIVYLITDQLGQPLENAPMEVILNDDAVDGALISLNDSGLGAQEAFENLRTDSNGEVSIWYITP